MSSLRLLTVSIYHIGQAIGSMLLQKNETTSQRFHSFWLQGNADDTPSAKVVSYDVNPINMSLHMYFTSLECAL